MTALERFKPKFDESIEKINSFMADPDMGELAQWMLNTETNPYNYLHSAGADSVYMAEPFAHLLWNIDWAIKYNDITFVKLNGIPVIVFANKDHPKFREKVLDGFSRCAGDNTVEILDIQPNEFGRVYDACAKEQE